MRGLSTRKKCEHRRCWPLAVRLASQFARPEDRGVGDTVARLIVGGETFKAAFRRLAGRDCGCEARQDALNEAYPYGSSTTYS